MHLPSGAIREPEMLDGSLLLPGCAAAASCVGLCARDCKVCWWCVALTRGSGLRGVLRVPLSAARSTYLELRGRPREIYEILGVVWGGQYAYAYIPVQWRPAGDVAYCARRGSRRLRYPLRRLPLFLLSNFFFSQVWYQVSGIGLYMPILPCFPPTATPSSPPDVFDKLSVTTTIVSNSM